MQHTGKTWTHHMIEAVQIIYLSNAGWHAWCSTDFVIWALIERALNLFSWSSASFRSWLRVVNLWNAMFITKLFIGVCALLVRYVSMRNVSNELCIVIRLLETLHVHVWMLCITCYKTWTKHLSQCMCANHPVLVAVFYDPIRLVQAFE